MENREVCEVCESRSVGGGVKPPSKPKGQPWCPACVRYEEAFRLSRVPRLYENASLKEYSEHLKNTDYYRYTEGVIKNLDRFMEEGRNIIFMGKVTGTGKTYNAMTILNEFVYRESMTNRFDFENPVGLYVAHAELMDRLRYSRDDEDLEKMMKQIVEVPLLVIDDLGSGTSSPFTRDQTFMIVNQRVNESLPTIVTTNMTLQELAEPDAIGMRTVSRLTTNVRVLKVEGADQRIENARRS